MYDKALAFLDGDAQGLMKAAELRQMLDGWTAEGFNLGIGLNLP